MKKKVTDNYPNLIRILIENKLLKKYCGSLTLIGKY